MESVHDSLSFLGVFGLLSESVIEENVTSLALNITDSISRNVGHLDEVGVGTLGQLIDRGTGSVVKLSKFSQINFGENNHQRLSLEKGLDGVEQVNLLLNGVTTSFRYVEQEQNSSVQMSQSSDSLHFNGVSLIERVV